MSFDVGPLSPPCGLIKVERKVPFKQGFTGVVVAETDMIPQEYHLSVGYFLRKVGLNPYLFSVARDKVEIDPELLTSKVDINDGKQTVAYKDGLNIYELVRRDDQIEVQWFGASMNIHFDGGTKYPCVRLHQLPVVRVAADKPLVSVALAALLQQMRDQGFQQLPLFQDIEYIACNRKIARRCLDEGRHYLHTENTWIIRCVLFLTFDVGICLRLKVDKFQVCEQQELGDRLWEILSTQILYLAR